MLKIIKPALIKPALCSIAVLSVLSACVATAPLKPMRTIAPLQSTADGEAITHFQNLMVQKPNEIAAVLGLARNLRWAGRVGEAASLLDTASSQFISDNRFLAERGKVYLLQGNAIKGVKFLRRAVKNGTTDWRLYSALGIGNDYLERYADAETAYQKALELCPDDSAVMNNLGVSQGLSGRMDRAIFTLQDALSYGQHTRKITRNLKLFKDARDLCSNCSTAYLKQSGSMILAAGLMSTDREGACSPKTDYTAARLPVMVEKLAPQVSTPSINIKVYFEFDSAILKPEALEVLDNLGKALTYGELNNFRFQIAGHTDAVGRSGYNQKLSERRAKAVLNYLVASFGIDATRIDPVGYGESQLLDPSDPQSDINRRVQVTRLDHL
ncbi:MAG: OmpA family protein [Magnetovibrio sp.]|nr:OmpA family protein [Magnetovibrio sp.]